MPDRVRNHLRSSQWKVWVEVAYDRIGTTAELINRACKGPTEKKLTDIFWKHLSPSSPSTTLIL